ncbi:OTU deubiquitinase with linear linkage specificity a [Neosynchiropus ocellatus]
MSWVRSVPSGGDDVFDENGDELYLMGKEWASSMKRRVRDGYVDGADAGEEASLQLGFNQGFREGAARTAAVGRLKGVVSALWCWFQIQHPGTPVPVSVTELLQQISQHEDVIRDRIQKTLENPTPSVSEVSDSMDELEVDQKDPGHCRGGCMEGDCCQSGNTKSPGSLPRTLGSGSKDWSAGLGESFEALLQRCLDLVSDLGVPQELVTHIEELRSLTV